MTQPEPRGDEIVGLNELLITIEAIRKWVRKLVRKSSGACIDLVLDGNRGVYNAH